MVKMLTEMQVSLPGKNFGIDLAEIKMSVLYNVLIRIHFFVCNF